jgi:hypothetical protein
VGDFGVIAGFGNLFGPFLDRPRVKGWMINDKG